MRNKMKHKHIVWILILVTAGLLISCTDKSAVKDPEQIPLDAPIPIDPKILKGTLDNGMTYYIREHKKPENRAELRLVVNAGAILEDDTQKGFAHLLEHLHFNGMADYPHNSLIDTLERIGIRFGHDLNAYTSFDETVYILEVPTDSLPLLKMGVNILENWACKLLFDSLEVEKEKGVVIEEFRSGRSARARMFDEHIKVLFKGSKYADRLTIGDTLVIRKAPHSEIKRYYHEWYRPDLMAVVAVGDFKADSMLTWLRDTFEPLPRPENPRERELFQVPDNKEPLYSICTDKEATVERASIYYKKKPIVNETAADYRQTLVENLYFRMLNARLAEISRKPDAPFVRASCGKGNYVRTVDVFGLNVIAKPGRLLESIEAILTEAERARRHGFLESELERAKKQLLTGYKRSYTERENRESESIASEYIRNFLRGESIPGIEWEYKLAQQEIPGIHLEEVMAVSEGLMTEENRIILVEMPEKEGLPVPTKDEINTIFEKVAASQIEPYTETALTEPLIAKLPEPGEIVREKEYPSVGVTEWTLSNGAKVVLKPTDFKADEIEFTAVSPGGWSLAPTEDLVSAKIGAQLIQQSGVGAYNVTDLQKKLAGKNVRVNPYIAILSEGMRGNSTVSDSKTLFEMIYSYFVQPRADSSAFNTLVEQYRARLYNAAADPESVYNDSVMAIMYDHHPRRKPMSLEDLDKMDMKIAVDFYKDRFAEAGDFTFVFVGSFTLEEMRPMVEQYLATLPTMNREESWRDEGVRFAKGLVEKEIYRGEEYKSINFMLLHSPFEYSPAEEFYITAMKDVVKARLREVIREESSGTYGVSVRGNISRFPVEETSVQFYFACEPARVKELTDKLIDELERIKAGELDPVAVEKVREIAIRQRENNLKQNRYWLNELKNIYFYGDDPEIILAVDDYIKNLSKEIVVEKAQKYLDTDEYIRVVLYPQK
ncbi:MAG TPA: insulinase family protein [Candidatus Marinimicrobia bacterium]|nr:insulinase family protein [Candidatus Neomarinimicrobiota bacterium]